MDESETRKENSKKISFNELFNQLGTLSSTQKMTLVLECLEGKIEIENFTPADGQRLKEIRNRLSAEDEWVITILQVPRLRKLVNQTLILPEEAVASLRTFENYFFRFSADRKRDWGENYATKMSLPTIKDKFNPKISQLIETVANSPLNLFSPYFSPTPKL